MSVLAHPDVPTHPPGMSIRSAPGHVTQVTGRSSSTDSASMHTGSHGVVPARVTLAAYQLMTPSSDGPPRPWRSRRRRERRSGGGGRAVVWPRSHRAARWPTTAPAEAVTRHTGHPQTRCHKRLKNRCRTTQPIPSSYPLSRSPTGISWAASGLGRWRQVDRGGPAVVTSLTERGVAYAPNRARQRRTDPNCTADGADSGPRLLVGRTGARSAMPRVR